MKRGRYTILAALAASVGAGIEACADKASGPQATAIEITVEPSSTAETMLPLATQPVIQAVDASGNPVAQAGLVVTASIASGNGDVKDGATATTDNNGVATFETLTIGSLSGQVGTVVLQFSAPGVPAVSATTNTELSCAIRAINVGSLTAASLVSGDCQRTTGQRFKLFDVTVADPTRALRITDTSAFRALVFARGPNEPVRFLGVGTLEGEPGLSFRVLVPPGVTQLMASSVDPGVSGQFTLRVQQAPEDDPGCEGSQWQSPVNTAQTLISACADQAGNVGDFFIFVLSTGASVTASVTSTAFVPYIAIWLLNPNERQIFQTDAGNTATASWTNSTGTSQIYYVFASSSPGTATGAYTFSASITNPVSPSPSNVIAPIMMPVPTRMLRGGPRLRP